MEIEMEKKVCTKCNKEKNLTEYHKDRSTKDGHTFACKECASAHRKKYYQENPEKEKAYQRKYYQENPEKERARIKKHRENNLEKERARCRLKEARRRAQKINTQS